MTEITFQRNENNEILSFTCKGHAGFAGFGKDIVCAALSMLTINTVNSLDAVAHQEIEVESDERTGFISCRIVGDCNSAAKVLMESYILGVTATSEQYGKKFCKVRFEEV